MKDLTGTHLPPLIETSQKIDTLPEVSSNIIPTETTEKPIDFEKKN